MVPFLSHLEQVKIFYSIWQGRPVCFMRKLLNFKGPMQVTHILDAHKDTINRFLSVFSLIFPRRGMLSKFCKRLLVNELRQLLG
jgi:hypothetical protein